MFTINTSKASISEKSEQACYESVAKGFRTESITKYMLTTINTC
jgi:hypothetical protein